MTTKIVEAITISNNQYISATFFYPANDIKGSVIIAPAMGANQKYYNAFATWLSLQGYLVATFDYHGIGDSLSGHIKNTDVTISDWAKYDCPAMIDAVSQKAKDVPLHWIGHSLGGQIIGMVPNRHLISNIVTIASGSGYWLENAIETKKFVWWLWFFIVPVSLKIFGYFPGKRLRKVGNLPKGVMHQWRKWCLDPDYMIGVEGNNIRSEYEMVETPITSFSFSDDEIMSARNINSMHGFYKNADKTMVRISPDQTPSKRIGHFGFFRASFEGSLWEPHLLPALQ